MKWEGDFIEDPFYTTGKKVQIKVETCKGFGLWFMLKRWNDGSYSTCFDRIALESSEPFDGGQVNMYRTQRHTAEFEIGLPFLRINLIVHKVDIDSEPCTPFDSKGLE